MKVDRILGALMWLALWALFLTFSAATWKLVIEAIVGLF